MANLTKKKEHGAKKSFRFGNSLAWEYRDGLWVAQGEHLDGSPWLLHMGQVRVNHMMELNVRYPLGRTLWEMGKRLLLIDQAIPYEDQYFVRWHFDQLVEWTSYEIWNHVYDQTRLTQGMDTKEAEKHANKEVTTWEMMFS